MAAPIVLIVGAAAAYLYERQQKGDVPAPPPLPVIDDHGQPVPALGPTIPADYACAIGLHEADGQHFLPISEDEALGMSSGGWQGGQLSIPAIEVMVAHAAVETGHFAKLHDYNCWNMIEVRKGYPFRVRSDAGSATDVDAATAGSQQKFAMFDSFKSCGARYLQLLRAYYPQAMLGAAKGSVEDYCYGLVKGKDGRKWYEARPESMIAALSAARKPVE